MAPSSPMPLGKAVVWYLSASYGLLGHTDLAVNRFGLPGMAFNVMLAGSVLGFFVMLVVLALRHFRARRVPSDDTTVVGAPMMSRVEAEQVFRESESSGFEVSDDARLSEAQNVLSGSGVTLARALNAGDTGERLSLSAPASMARHDFGRYWVAFPSWVFLALGTAALAANRIGANWWMLYLLVGGLVIVLGRIPRLRRPV